MIRAIWFLALSTLAVVLATWPILDYGTKAQTEASFDAPTYFRFPHEIRRVAVIGAGAAGLQQASALIDQGFKVRLFERKPTPGGVWTYSTKTPVRAPFPYVSSGLKACPLQ